MNSHRDRSEETPWVTGTCHRLPRCLFLSLFLFGFLVGSQVVFAEGEDKNSSEPEIAAVNIMVQRVDKLIQGLETALQESKERLAIERRASNPKSYRWQSQSRFKNALDILWTFKTHEVANQLIWKARSEKPDDVVSVSYLTGLYVDAIRSGIAEVDKHLAAERDIIKLLTAELATVALVLEQMKIVKDGLQKFKIALENQRYWWQDPMDMSEFFASDEFKTRITELSKSVEEIQKEVAKREEESKEGAK